jgi:AraC family transcriptional regulator
MTKPQGLAAEHERAGVSRSHAAPSLARFERADTHRILPRSSRVPDASSDALGWSALYASVQQEGPFSGSFPAVEDQLIVLHIDGPVHVSGRIGGASFSREVPAGGIHLVPGGVDFRVRLGAPLRSLHVYVRRSVLRDVAARLPGGGRLGVRPGIIDADPALRSLLDAVGHVVSERAAGTDRLSVHLAQAIAAHLLRTYGCAEAAEAAAEDAAAVDAAPLPGPVTRAIRFMRAHLRRPIETADIARAAGLSPRRLSRDFQAGTGASPYQFLLRLRVETGRAMLRQGDRSLDEIAQDCGFANPEHFSRHFRRHHGLPPGAYRRAHAQVALEA